MHGDQESFANELVKFEIVHVAVLTNLRSMNHDEHVVGVDVHSRRVATLPGRGDSHRMEAEFLGQH